tara:strand:- start:418 stop:903 length:486 start_codon:yes stop_codon:yes gene_type:complete
MKIIFLIKVMILTKKKLKMIILSFCIFYWGASFCHATHVMNHSGSIEDFKKSFHNFNRLSLSEKKCLDNFVLDKGEWGDILVASYYSKKWDFYLKEKNSFKSSKYLLKSAWSGDDDALNYLDTLLKNSDLDKSVLDSYNEKDEKSFKGYFFLVKERLENEQ